MQYKNLHYVLFDLDNTLTDRDKSARRCFKEVLTLNGCSNMVPNPDAFFTQYDGNGESTRQDFFRQLVQLYHIDISVDKLVHDWFELVAYDTEEFPGTTRILEQIRTRYKTGLLTNGYSSNQRQKLRCTNLTHYFDAICIGEEIGFEKPDPRAYNCILQKLGALPEECVYIGDSIRNDVFGALQVGIKPIWKVLPMYGDMWEKEDYAGIVKIHSLNELPKLLGI